MYYIDAFDHPSAVGWPRQPSPGAAAAGASAAAAACRPRAPGGEVVLQDPHAEGAPGARLAQGQRPRAPWVAEEGVAARWFGRGGKAERKNKT